MADTLILTWPNTVLGEGMTGRAFFATSEYKVFVHPTTGQKFAASRLRIDCSGNPAYDWYGCTISAIKQ